MAQAQRPHPLGEEAWRWTAGVGPRAIRTLSLFLPSLACHLHPHAHMMLINDPPATRPRGKGQKA